MATRRQTKAAKDAQDAAERPVERATAYNKIEMLQVADAVAREKSIDREEVLEAMEQAIQKAGRAKYGHEHDIRANIDRATGQIQLLRYRQVADPIENEATQISVAEAQGKNPDAQVGDFLTDPLPPIDFGRIAAQTAKQVIVQRVREAERKRQFNEYKDRVGEIVNGLVKRVETRGPQIFLSRTHGQFMAKLFAQEVPEIYDGIIEIKAVARDPGSRAKIAVISNDSSIDPVGACVGMRGSRVQAVVAELQGEKIDIIPWSPDPATFVVNALAPAEVTKVVLDEEARRIEVVVPDDQLSLAIGRRGQNVRLASLLTGWAIDILTEAEESERRQEEFKSRSALFVEALDVDDVIAGLLVTEGFVKVEDIALVPVDELAGIEGFDEGVAGELKARAETWLESQNLKLTERYKELGVGEDVAGIEGMTPAMLVKLGEKGVKTLDDLGDLASDELIDIVGKDALDNDQANAVIMAARAHWFEADAAEAKPA
jgi:N utilization substance protein A